MTVENVCSFISWSFKKILVCYEHVSDARENKLDLISIAMQKQWADLIPTGHPNEHMAYFKQGQQT